MPPHQPLPAPSLLLRKRTNTFNIFFCNCEGLNKQLRSSAPPYELPMRYPVRNTRMPPTIT